ncbi:MAG: hypothetical protein JXQ87_13000 [Bacteroidia bacterium]
MSLKNIRKAVLLQALILWFSANVLKAQHLVLQDSIPVSKAKKVRVDDLGNIFLLHRDNSVEVYTARGQHFTHNEKSLGKIINIDVSNPMRILLHYADANMVMFVDNTLTEMGRVQLQNFGIYGQNILVANSKLGGFWIYDPIQQAINRFDISGKKFAGNQLNVIEKDLQPSFLYEKNAQVYMALSNGQLIVLDINGTLSARYGKSLKIASEFQVEDESIFWVNNDSLCTFNTVSHSQKNLPLPNTVLNNAAKPKIFVVDEKAYILVKLKLFVYLIK